jgi:polysaccharide pyruvyl transferase WcaK-like protein
MTGSDTPFLVPRSTIHPDAERTPFELTVFDTAIGSQNVGDQIIANAVHALLQDLFPQAHAWTIPTHDIYGAAGRKRQRHSLFSITTGTNILAPGMPGKGLWKFPVFFRPAPVPFGHLRPRNLVLCAAGSNAQPLSRGAARFLRESLWDKVPVSARDKATAEIVRQAGIANVLHTSCVTLWALPEDHPRTIPHAKAPEAVVVLTGTRRAERSFVERDIALLRAVREAYGRVFFWPQGQVDLEYLASLGPQGLEILPHNLDAFTRLLRERPAIDYAGTRLHAGIHAIMHGRRSLILPIDNRANDMGSSVGLPVLAPAPSGELSARLNGTWETRIDLPRAAIAQWKEALRSAVRQTLAPDLDLTRFRGR